MFREFPIKPFGLPRLLNSASHSAPGLPSHVTGLGWGFGSSRGKSMRSPGGKSYYASLPPPQLPVLRDLA